MAYGEVGKLVKNVGTSIFNRTLGRLTGAGISIDNKIVQARAKWSGRSDTEDWRVRLQVPQQATDLQQAIFGNGLTDRNDLLEPLRQEDFNGMFWPLTPAVVIQHSANYNALAQTHNNYPFQAYQNSQVDSLNIIGEFPVQNSEDAKHWVATVNFLRIVTKMFFGNGSGVLKGNPPPILHLSGYGDHMFHKVPVVVNTFNVELRPGIDYISTKQNNTPYRELNGPDAGVDLSAEQGASQTWAPTLSNISVLVTPVYSRNSIIDFSLQEFARGKLNGKETGIGFI
jgi:hypothetical protein